jgi:hypothetical protein
MAWGGWSYPDEVAAAAMTVGAGDFDCANAGAVRQAAKRTGKKPNGRIFADFI